MLGIQAVADILDESLHDWTYGITESEVYGTAPAVSRMGPVLRYMYVWSMAHRYVTDTTGPDQISPLSYRKTRSDMTG